MNRKLIQWLGLTGIVALLSYTAAVVFAPLAFVLDWTLLREVDPIGDVRAVRAAADPVRVPAAQAARMVLVA